MNDANVLSTVAAIRETCDGIARNIATHAASDSHGDHGATDCTEGTSRMAAGFALIAATASHATADLTSEVAEAVRDLLSALGDEDETTEDGE